MGILLALLAILHWGQPAAQDSAQVKQVTVADVAEAVEAKEPRWDFIAGVCTCPALVTGQKSQSVGTWERKAEGVEREVILMDIYEIESAEGAAEWMKRFGRKEPNGVCQVEKYALGDEAYRLDCPISQGDTIKANISVYFRRGSHIVNVRGSLQETVERFAGYALSRLPAS